MILYVTYLHGLFTRWIGVERVEGQGLVEYALVILLIAIACIAAVSSFGGALDQTYQRIAAAIP